MQLRRQSRRGRSGKEKKNETTKRAGGFTSKQRIKGVAEHCAMQVQEHPKKAKECRADQSQWRCWAELVLSDTGVVAKADVSARFEWNGDDGRKGHT